MDQPNAPDERPMSNELDAAQATEPSPSGRGRWRAIGRRPWLTTMVGVLVIPLLLAGGLTAMATVKVDPSDAKVVSIETLERDYGVRFDLIGVTAAGGLVDLRFTVLDAEKAKALFHDAASSPALFIENTGSVLRTKKGMSHRLNLLAGGRYFMLFSNAGGVVQSGTRVSVVINDIRLEPIAAMS
jgi:hypothetical protein